jgi:MFS family permease
MQESTTEKVLNPTVVKLGLVALLADISSEMLYPITPIFLTSVLGASMASVGLIEGFAEAMASLLKTYSGAWSDRIAKRAPFVAFGYFLSALGKPLTGFAQTWTHVLIARAIDRTGKGLRTAPRDALLSEAVSEKVRGLAFGWHRAMDTLGAALGPLIALGFLTTNPQDLRKLYFWAFLPGLMAVGIAMLVRDPKRERAATPPPIKLFKFGPLTPDFRRYLSAWTLFSLVNSSDVFLLMKTKAAGVSLAEVILIYCFYNLVYAGFSPVFGGLSDRLGRARVLVFGLVIFAGVYLGFAAATARWQFWALFGVYGLYIAATDGVGKALAVDLVPAADKATGLGTLGTFTGLATIVASTIAGLLWDHCGPAAPVVYGTVGSLVAAWMLRRIR